MSFPRSARTLLAIVLLLLAVPIVSVGSGSPVAAETADLPVTVTAAPTTNLVDGTTVSINVDAQSPPNSVASSIYGVEARICKASAVIDFSADFNPTQTGKCALHPLSANSDAKTEVAIGPPYDEADLDFRVGVGTDTYQRQNGDNVTITCGPSDPCKLVVKVQIPDAVGFASFPLLYAGGVTVPGAPTNATAVGGNASATVTWTAPTSDGGATITSYTVTSNPGGKTCTWTTGPLSCTVGDLTNGTPYTFTVTAANSAGSGSASSPSNSVTPSADSGLLYHPVTPTRIIDPRPGTGQVGPYTTAWGAKVSRDVQVTGGASGVPAGADAVVLNVTATGASADSFLTVHPAGTTRPRVSNLNFSAGQTIPNAVTVGLSDLGRIAVYNSAGNVNVLVDVVGYYDEAAGGAGFTSIAPNRIIDPRPGSGQVGPYTTAWGAKVSRDVQVTGGASGVPAGADAVVLNVTATGASADSFLTVHPAGTTRPRVSNLNFSAGQTIPNAVTVGLSDLGRIAVYNSAGNVNVLVDVVGYFDVGSGEAFHTVTPTRIIDPRPGTGQVGPYTTAWGAKVSRDVQVTGGPSGVPAGADSVLVNATATGTTAASFLTVHPAGTTRPRVSSLNWEAGNTIPNAVTAKLSAGGAIAAYNSAGNVNVLVDVAGWYG